MKMLSGSPSVVMTWMVRRTDARNSGYMRRWQPPKISLANRVVPLRTACWIWDALNERFQDKQQHDSLPNAFVKSCRSLLQKVKARWHGCHGCRKCSPNANGRRKWVFPPKLVAGFVFVMLVFMQRLRWHKARCGMAAVRSCFPAFKAPSKTAKSRGSAANVVEEDPATFWSLSQAPMELSPPAMWH